MSAEPNLTERDYELLSAYLDGELTEIERSALEARLESEAMLRRELSALRQTVALLNQLPALKAPRDLTLDVTKVQPRVIEYPPQRRGVNLTRLTAVAAMVMIVLFAGIVLTALLGPAIGNISSNVVGALRESGGSQPSAAQVAAAPTATPLTLNLQSPTPTQLSPETAAGLAIPPSGGQPVDTQQSFLAQKTLDETSTPEGYDETLSRGASEEGQTGLELAAPSLPATGEQETSPATLEVQGAFSVSPTQPALYALPPEITEQASDLVSQNQAAPQESPLLNVSVVPTLSPTPQPVGGAVPSVGLAGSPMPQPTSIAEGRTREPQAERDEQAEESRSPGMNTVAVIVVVVGLAAAGIFLLVRSRQP